MTRCPVISLNGTAPEARASILQAAPIGRTGDSEAAEAIFAAALGHLLAEELAAGTASLEVFVGWPARPRGLDAPARLLPREGSAGLPQPDRPG
ncbi:MAG: hypothetical protein KDK12_17995 [Rhodobacteraceae bacterium]|nr:hypothetical protein [Paracoccaceae bacterium]